MPGIVDKNGEWSTLSYHSSLERHTVVNIYLYTEDNAMVINGIYSSSN